MCHIETGDSKKGSKPGRRRSRYFLTFEGKEGNPKRRRRKREVHAAPTAGEGDVGTAGDIHAGPRQASFSTNVGK
jgi:hypothetical protein